jgi:hypothetical protein
VWPPTALNLAPVLGALVAVPAPIVGLAAGPASAWTLLRTHGGGSAVAVTTPDARARVAVSSPRAPIAISAYGELVCVLVRGQVIRINASTGHVVQHIPVPPSARTVSVYPGHVVLSMPATGEVIDISLRSPRTRAVTIVSAPVRAVVAGENDFWASAGADATPNKFYGF